MATRLNAYLNFDGTAGEAMTFYQQVLGGQLRMNTFGEFGMEGPGAEKIMHANLETDGGLYLMASDTPPADAGHGDQFDLKPGPGNAMSLSLSGEDVEELRGYWDALSGSGTVTMPLEKQMWGDEFGMCQDRFGVPWMVNIVAPQG